MADAESKKFRSKRIRLSPEKEIEGLSPPKAQKNYKEGAIVDEEPILSNFSVFQETGCSSREHDGGNNEFSKHEQFDGDDFPSCFSVEDDIDNIEERHYQPIAGPMGWVQRQMTLGINPREILSYMIPHAKVPTEIEDSHSTLWKIIIGLLTSPTPRQKLDYVNTLDDVVSLVNSCKNIVVLTGAGVSVSCGIPDFRSRDGIYARLSQEYPDLPDPQAMFDITYFNQNPKPFFKFAKLYMRRNMNIYGYNSKNFILKRMTRGLKWAKHQVDLVHISAKNSYNLTLYYFDLRYKTGQLREDLEKVLVTEAEQSYHNSLLSSRRRSRSVDSLTSLRLQEMSRDLNCPAHPDTNQKRVSILNTKSVSICPTQSSFGSEISDEGSFQLLRDFLEISGKACDVCSLLDRPMVICNDWRNLASEFSYKMIHIRLWERNHSPCMTLLENITVRDPDTRVSKLIDKLSAIDRHDVIRLIQGREPKSDSRTVWHFAFSTRKQLSFELDNATKEQFHLVVSDIFKDLEASKIESLRKRPSPTMALLEELETICPCLPMSHVRDACYRAKAYGAVKIMDSHIRKKSFQGKISSHRNLFEHVGSDESKSVASLSRDSAIEQDLMEHEGS